MPKKKTTDITETVLIDGAEYELVVPHNFTELMQAIKIRDLIQDAISTSSPEYHNANLREGLETQQAHIQNYMDENVGEFDNRYLINNIAFLAKKSGLRIGELEKLLGLSAGYISRTAKESSSKKLSIDVVWKIGRLFEESIESLLETNLRIPNSNADLVAQFLAKLTYQTEHHSIYWDNHGGAQFYLIDLYDQLDFFKVNNDGSVRYKPERIWDDKEYDLRSDVYGCYITDEKELLIFEYGDSQQDKTYGYDFVIVWSTRENNARKLKWEYAFSSTGDYTQTIEKYAEALMNAVQAQNMDAYVPDEVRDMIIDYLK